MIGIKDVDALAMATLLKECYETKPMYLTRQLAEECTEFAQSAMKLMRAANQETPVSVLEARDAMLEELADVILCADLVMAFYKQNVTSAVERVNEIMDEKRMRAVKRVIDRNDMGGNDK